jgi:DNA (cytosine-5)-methyltransferase 1
MQEIVASAYVPQVITKELAIGQSSDRRRVVLSSNFLRLVGFEPDTRHSISTIPMGGMDIRFDPHGSHKVYTRRYNSRRNNPFEAQIDIHNKSILDEAFPSYTERLHFELRHGEIKVRPLAARTTNIRRRNYDPDNLAAFVAMTSGVDARCLKDTGFTIDTILEYRPQEKRDNTDLTETGALTAIGNIPVRCLINEDISKVDMARVATLLAEGPPLSVLHISLQCDDFSPLKSKEMRETSRANLDTTADLCYDALRLVETAQPACVMLEQVPGFAQSGEGRLFATKLAKWGYHVTDGIFDARDHNGLTSRTRYYLVASVWPGFQFPDQQPRSDQSIWPLVEPYLSECRDVSHTSSVAKGIETGRIRTITPNSVSSPTITKSQSRQAKDSVFILHEGRYLLPTNSLITRLNGIPSDFNFANVAETIQSEIVGQSIDYPMHERITIALHEHISINNGKTPIVHIRPTPRPAINVDKAAETKTETPRQQSLF